MKPTDNITNQKNIGQVAAVASQLASDTAKIAVNLAEEVSKSTTATAVTLAVIQRDIKYTKDQVDEMNRRLDSQTVNKATFEPIRSLVAAHDIKLEVLSATNFRQQGSIDANRRFTTIGLAILGLLVAVYAAWHRR